MFNLNPSSMKRLFVLVLAVLSILTFSCKKSSNDATPATQADYYQLKVGNYWIYQGYQFDSNGVAVPRNVYDSAHIEKDTIIRGNTYYKLWEDEALIMGIQFASYLRDSSGYLVNNLGVRLCSKDNFIDTLYVNKIHPQVFIGYVLMTGRDSLVSVQAGTFPSITSRMKVVPVQPKDHHPIRYTFDVYGKGIGKLKTHDFFYDGDTHFESRLVRYKVQ